MDNLENVIDSKTAAEMLGISSNNLRQIVWRKLLVPVGKQKRKSMFNIADIERIKNLRTPSV